MGASKSPPVERLRDYVRERGLSQRAFAAELGCKQPSVSRILCGDKGVGIRLAAAIERVTGIKASEWASDEREAVR